MLIYMKKELSTSKLCGTGEKYKHLGKVREQGGGGNTRGARVCQFYIGESIILSIYTGYIERLFS